MSDKDNNDELFGGDNLFARMAERVHEEVMKLLSPDQQSVEKKLIVEERHKPISEDEVINFMIDLKTKTPEQLHEMYGI